MMFNQCPGQNQRQAQAESIICNNCGEIGEIFSDEVKVLCFKCKSLIYKQRLPSCVNWCKAVRECIGEEKYKQLK